jgi:hypothetical protein
MTKNTKPNASGQTDDGFTMPPEIQKLLEWSTARSEKMKPVADLQAVTDVFTAVIQVLETPEFKTAIKKTLSLKERFSFLKPAYIWWKLDRAVKKGDQDKAVRVATEELLHFVETMVPRFKKALGEDVLVNALAQSPSYMPAAADFFRSQGSTEIADLCEKAEKIVREASTERTNVFKETLKRV